MPSLQGWFKPGPQIVRAYCRSEIFLRPFHFCDGIGHAACRDAGCELCAFLPREVHGIIVVQVGPMRDLKLIELRPRLHAAIAEACEHGPDLVGRPLWAWRDMTEHGHPVEISFDRPEHAPRTQSEAKLEMHPVPCARYIERIGSREYRIALGRLDQLRLAIDQPPSLPAHA